MVGGGGGVLPVCGEVAGAAGKQRQPSAAGVPQTMLCAQLLLRRRGSGTDCWQRAYWGGWQTGSPPSVIQLDSFPASAHVAWT